MSPLTLSHKFASNPPITFTHFPWFTAAFSTPFLTSFPHPFSLISLFFFQKKAASYHHFSTSGVIRVFLNSQSKTTAETSEEIHGGFIWQQCSCCACQEHWCSCTVRTMPAFFSLSFSFVSNGLPCTTLFVVFFFGVTRNPSITVESVHRININKMLIQSKLFIADKLKLRRSIGLRCL